MAKPQPAEHGHCTVLNTRGPHEPFSFLVLNKFSQNTSSKLGSLTQPRLSIPFTFLPPPDLIVVFLQFQSSFQTVHQYISIGQLMRTHSIPTIASTHISNKAITDATTIQLSYSNNKLIKETNSQGHTSNTSLPAKAKDLLQDIYTHKHSPTVTILINLQILTSCIG